MKDLKNRRLGVLENTIIEFRNKGISSIEEIRAYLISKYNLSVSRDILRKRIDAIGY